MIEIQTWLVEHPKAERKCGRSEIVPTVTMGGETLLPNSKGKTKRASMIRKFDSCSNRVLAVHLCNISIVSDFNVDMWEPARKHTLHQLSTCQCHPERSSGLYKLLREILDPTQGFLTAATLNITTGLYCHCPPFGSIAPPRRE